MNYYSEVHVMNTELERLLRRKKEPASLPEIVYELTTRFRVGEKTIKNRLNLLVEVGIIEEIGGYFIWIRNSRNGSRSASSPKSAIGSVESQNTQETLTEEENTTPSPTSSDALSLDEL